INERATETAKKIRKTLKKAFPNTKFSVRSSTFSMGSSVYVSWVDGPLKSDVDSILNRFKSGYFDYMTDVYKITGYEWEGKLVVGAKYISCSRELSPERRARILTKLQESEPDGSWGDFKIHEQTAAEVQLITACELEGHPSQLSGKEVKIYET
ncbi:LPD29 domain-containing protein, partial [Paenibacillus larvae]|nr:hypothetical protein [Paenibacillus larvae]MCY9681667.1 hypothetical protein [Paenibacillus larvae]MCY9752379.1 hypothetical protein [Paenibacillus larvae]MCY9775028.1 hypothetical protein [Paenibacillus larvae]